MLTAYAAKRARLLFGGYRKGDANDPETYVASITAVLSRYPTDVIQMVTHPVDGLQARLKFLPSICEVREACEAIMQPRRAADARERDMARQREEREEFERRRNTPEHDAHVSEGLRKLAAELRNNSRQE